ncbi:MAG TPA: GNAT family N-acetyltransferase [Gaiellaceae bacterium]
MELASQRLVLRPVAVDDLDFSVQLRNSLDHLASPRPEPRPRAEAERQLRRAVEQWREQGFGSWTVVDRGSSERLGRIELESIGPGWPAIAPDEVEVGCVLDPAHWNHGIATEATQLAIEDFFGRVGRRRLVALASADNPASLRVLEKLGMRCCGETHREGDVTPYLLFELVRPDAWA